MKPNPNPDAVTRRSFLASAAATVASLRATHTSRADVFARRRPEPTRAPAPLVDTNVTLGRWPLRRLPDDEPRRLVDRLRRHDVREAWAGTFDGLLHKDLASANTRLAETCRRFGRGLFVPFGSINPRAPGWEDELARCADVHRMPGIRLHPNYHGYRLDDPIFAALLEAAARRGLLVQVALVMEDERMMHPLSRVEPVDPQPLAAVLRAVPNVRVHLVNALRTLRAKPLLDLLSTGRVTVEISMLEGVAGLERLLSQVPAERVLFGSHAPLFYFESALLKLRESELGSRALRLVTAENARTLLAMNPPSPPAPLPSATGVGGDAERRRPRVRLPAVHDPNA
ncbi:MAG: amidohydrolase family protein [Verrucomicrobiales bacterium]|nr:amidohydrolase family protein [Verrucomicrobiales bacterium]